MSKDIQPTFAKNSTFEVFRYQLVVDKTMPINMFGKYENAEQLRAEKNNILKDIITKDNFRFTSSNSSIKSKLVHQSGDMYYFKISAKRTAHIYREDFTEDTIDNEHMNKKKSNICCIFHKTKLSPDDSDTSTCDSCDEKGKNAYERPNHYDRKKHVK